jgi:hypothetical protein
MVDLESLFPGLIGADYRITSSVAQVYNCIAWAAGDIDRWWWPDVSKKRYWPAGVTRLETVASFQEAFGSLGFIVCENEDLEAGVEKIALFVDNDGPQHAARQLPDGRWTSKLGELEDIQHPLHALEGAEYGKVVVVLSRRVHEP